MKRSSRPQIDRSTAALPIINYAHKEVHGGSSYHCSDVQAVDTTTLKWMITTPNTTKWAHMFFGVECTGEMLLLVTEGADRTGTNLLAAVNHARNSTSTAGVVVHRAYSGGTTDGATSIYTKRVGSTGVASKTISTGGSRAVNEYILKQNTKYIVSVTTYAAVNVSLELDWYEHTDKS